MDRDDAHPTARAILEGDLFWNEGDEYGPHGNDTGHDVLSAYVAATSKRAPDPAKFLARLLAKWRLVAGDWYMLEGSRAARAAERDPSRLLLDDALIALAFAVLKVRGELPPSLREIATIAVKRQSHEAIVRLRGWSDPSRRITTLAEMQRVLEL